VGIWESGPMDKCYCEKLSQINYHTVCEVCWNALKNEKSKHVSGETYNQDQMVANYLRGFKDGVKAEEESNPSKCIHGVYDKEECKECTPAVSEERTHNIGCSHCGGMLRLKVNSYGLVMSKLPPKGAR